MTNPPFGTYDPATAQVNGATPAAPGTPRLYLDLDGVMADFDTHFPATFGCDHRGMADDALWETINAHPSYFRDMPPCPGAVAFFRTIEHLDPIILTACPKSNYAHVARQKRAWVREHLSKDVVILPVMGGKSKPLFMHAPGDVLIDDFARNTDAWTAEGGVAILHRTFAETAAALAVVLSSAAKPALKMPRWRHVKRGTEYEIVAGASLQASAPVKDGENMIVYRGEDGQFWVRPHDEFHDGRFVRLTAVIGGSS